LDAAAEGLEQLAPLLVGLRYGEQRLNRHFQSAGKFFELAIRDLRFVLLDEIVEPLEHLPLLFREALTDCGPLLVFP
jgi:hypothetical protein